MFLFSLQMVVECKLLCSHILFKFLFLSSLSLYHPTLAADSITHKVFCFIKQRIILSLNSRA